MNIINKCLNACITLCHSLRTIIHFALAFGLLQNQDAKIIVLNMYQHKARRVFCEVRFQLFLHYTSIFLVLLFKGCPTLAILMFDAITFLRVSVMCVMGLPVYSIYRIYDFVQMSSCTVNQFWKMDIIRCCIYR